VSRERTAEPTELERVQGYGLALCAALFLVHYTLLSWWFIEDAAISFAFARNAADGFGFVTYPGGERVEGFSNPSWTLLLTFFEIIGINSFIAAKILGATLGIGTLHLAFRWARRLNPDHRHFPLLAPAFLAFSPQFVLWCASGLENSLFGALLAAACVLQWREIDTRRYLGSGLLWMLLAMTRPEAPLYAAVGGVIGFVIAAHRQGPPWALGWGLMWNLSFVTPFAAWHLWRWNYFAWPFPNTYYAKLAETDKFQPWNWGVRGWNYLREYAWTSGQGWLLPMYALAQSGMRGARGGAALLLVGLTAITIVPELMFLQDFPWPDLVGHTAWAQARVGLLALTVAIVPLLGARREGAGERGLAWLLAVTAVFFALYSGGDWMKGHRWLSMAAVPLSVLFADAFAAVYTYLDLHFGDGFLRRVVGRGLLLLPAVLSIVATATFLGRPETSPYDVHRRVKHMQRVAERIGLERPVLMDVDMGAHMWWSGFEIVDMAGLVDVPMGHHKWQLPFVREYVYGERNPDFAHVHGSWGGTRTNMTRHAEWSGYIEVDPYPVSPYTAHPGNHIRKDLFIRSEWSGGRERSAAFENGVQLLGLDIPHTEVFGELTVELALRWPNARADFRLWLFLHGPGGLIVREIPPGYDWYPPSRWRSDEVILGRHRIALPDDLQPGTYAIGVALAGVGPGAALIAAMNPAQDPRLAAGEARWEDAITVLPRAEASARADAALSDAVAAVAGRPCSVDSTVFRAAHGFLPHNHPWHAAARERYRAPLAACLAERAAREQNPAWVAEARRLAPFDASVALAAAALADLAQAAGEDAFAKGDLDTAHRAWLHALTADPTRSALRRRIEEIRDRRLGLSANDPAPSSDGGGGD
jgi:hypothetical protein